MVGASEATPLFERLCPAKTTVDIEILGRHLSASGED
jgi:hypothetical protein